MLKRLAVLAVFAAGSAIAAHADPIVGTISITGSDTFTSNSIEFFSAAINGGSGANTGAFSILTDGNAVLMFPGFSGALPYNQGQQTVPANISPVEILRTTEKGVTFSFFMTDYNAILVNNVLGCTGQTCLDVTGNGFFTGTGYDQTNGSFTFTTQLAPGQTTTTFSASGLSSGVNPPPPVPEPASLLMVGTGIAGAAGLLRRRFATNA